MKCEDQYPITPFTFKVLNLLAARPGLQASQIAPYLWPHLRKAGLLAALKLHRIAQAGLIFSKFVPPILKPGKIKPKKRYYLTDEGFTVHEFHARKHAAQNSHAPNGNGAGRPRDGTGAQRRT